ncbi:MAG: hypothetical protein COA79_15170 [Planctomycetota bacterium]|nr:MAG: hypothetical protein COA79_15170 [Planctomycetota bacterium]
MKIKQLILKTIQCVQNSDMSYSRFTELLIGSSIFAFMTIGYFFHPVFYYLILIQALYLIYSGIKNECIISNLLKKLGFLDKKIICTVKPNPKI